MAGTKRTKSRKNTTVSKAVKQYVNRALDAQVEDKYKFVTLETNFSSLGGIAWTELDFGIVSQGTTTNSRIGNKIRIKSIEINGVLAQAAVEAALDEPYNLVRMVLAQWNGSSQTPLTAGGYTIDEPIIKDWKSQGRLITKYMDKVFPLTITSTEKGGGDGYTPQLKSVKYFKSFGKGIPIVYADETAAYPNKRFILSCISDSLVVPNPGFIQGFVKIRFEDA